MKTLFIFVLSLFTYNSIAQCANYALDINYSEPSCFGVNDGDISLSTTGGNGGDIFEITFNGSIINVSSVANNLITGTYFIEVTDNMGCQIMQTFFLDEPGELDIDYTVSHPDCYGAPTGNIVVDTVFNYQGGYNDIMYLWNPNPNSSFNNTLTDAIAELYIVKIEDINGCQRIFEFILENPDSMYFDQIGITNCVNGGDGQVFASVLGGENNAGNGISYNYLWTEDATGLTSMNSTWGNLDAGMYTILVSNDLGCSISDSVSIGCLSTNEFDLSETFEVLPTLVNEDVISVSIKGQNVSSIFVFVVYDMMGKEVFRKTIESNNEKLYPMLDYGEYLYIIISLEKQERLKKGKLIIIN